MVDAHGSRLLGAVTYMVPRLPEGLDKLFRLAARKGFNLDFHVDETADPFESEAMGRGGYVPKF